MCNVFSFVVRCNYPETKASGDRGFGVLQVICSQLQWADRSHGSAEAGAGPPTRHLPPSQRWTTYIFTESILTANVGKSLSHSRGRTFPLLTQSILHQPPAFCHYRFRCRTWQKLSGPEEHSHVAEQTQEVIILLASCANQSKVVCFSLILITLISPTDFSYRFPH